MKLWTMVPTLRMGCGEPLTCCPWLSRMVFWAKPPDRQQDLELLASRCDQPNLFNKVAKNNGVPGGW